MTAMTPDHKRYRLRTQLLQARLDAGLPQKDVAEQLRWHVSKLNRIENGLVSVSVTDVRALAAYYGAEASLGEWEDLADGSRNLTWAPHKVLSTETILYFGYEGFATAIRNFENLLVPGLLQTSDYTRAILTQVFGFSVADADQHIEIRQERQRRLSGNDDAPETIFILDESVLRRSVGGHILEKQVQRLRELTEQPHVSIQVLPFNAGATFAMRGPFVHLHFKDRHDPDLLYFEGKSATETFSIDEAQSALHKAEFENLVHLSVDLAKWTAE